ncbi:putative replicase-associated protein [Thin paspalum asymptomatic virus]|nr:putative replicase-associated protein [Thin paspalum asymptomatic virus]AGO96555.1 putative replicase-associated protein [Thin paspalum asymptomatic virus]
MESFVSRISEALSSCDANLDYDKMLLILKHCPDKLLSWASGIEGLQTHQLKVAITHLVKTEFHTCKHLLTTMSATTADYIKMFMELSPEQEVIINTGGTVSWWPKLIRDIPEWFTDKIPHYILQIVDFILRWVSRITGKVRPSSPKESNSSSTRPSWLRLLVEVGLVAAAWYGVYKYISLSEEIVRRDQAQTRPDHMRQCYEQVKESLEEQNNRFIHDRMEEELTKLVIEPAEIDEDGKEVKPEVSQYLVRHHGKFVRALVTMAKNEFAGVPKPTEANQLAVWRFLYRQCDKRGVNPTDTQKSISAALPFVFLPSAYDQDQAITMNCDDAKEMLQRYADTFRYTTPLQKLVHNPLMGKHWVAWARSIFISDPETGLRFAK